MPESDGFGGLVVPLAHQRVDGRAHLDADRIVLGREDARVGRVVRRYLAVLYLSPFRQSTSYIDESYGVWVLDATLNRLLKYDRDGRLQYTWGAYSEAAAIRRPPWPAGLVLPHQAAVDQEGNLYVASYDGGHVQKFVPRPGPCPAKLLGAPMLLN